MMKYEKTGVHTMLYIYSQARRNVPRAEILAGHSIPLPPPPSKKKVTKNSSNICGITPNTIASYTTPS